MTTLAKWLGRAPMLCWLLIALFATFNAAASIALDRPWGDDVTFAALSWLLVALYRRNCWLEEKVTSLTLLKPKVEIRRARDRPTECRVWSPDGRLLFDGVSRDVVVQHRVTTRSRS